MEKVFLCKWGSWDEYALNSYDPDKTQEVGIDFFSQDNGYEEEDLDAVHNLKVGEIYNEVYGNHTIERLM
ncbi:hypothetical protein ACFQZX_17870 [Mucilaginibacter litoreus]|uniref:Uncharacterized protein n=1 Tax=Mucilaginibacter litoreus TaxID=1048221 RepID=A0ABW3AX97_9SPHI